MFSDVDECEIDNGGCEQLCKNMPGSFECACQPGLQIDTSNGKACVGKLWSLLPIITHPRLINILKFDFKNYFKDIKILSFNISMVWSSRESLILSTISYFGMIPYR